MGIFSAKSICNVQKPLNSGSGSSKETWLAHPWPPPWPSEAPTHTHLQWGCLATRNCHQHTHQWAPLQHTPTHTQKKSLLFPQQPTRGPFWHEQKRGNLLGAPHFDLVRKSKVRTFIFTPNSDSENQRSPWGRGTNLQYSFLFSQPAPSKVRTTVLSSWLEWTVTHPVPSTVSKMASVSFLSEQTTRM